GLAAAAALAAVVAGGPAVQRPRQNRQPGRDAGDIETFGGLLHHQLVAARLGRREEQAVGGVGDVLLAPKYAHERLELVVIGTDVVVADRPVVAEPVERLRLEVARPEAQRDATPVVGAATHHAGAPPPELVPLSDGVGLAGNLPATDATVELAERFQFGGGAAAWGVVRPGEHRRVGRVVPRAAGLEHGHVHTGAGEDVGRHSTAGARAHDHDIRGWRLCARSHSCSSSLQGLIHYSQGTETCE